jgi:tetratricopeptide (TPR) repeat protein
MLGLAYEMSGNLKAALKSYEKSLDLYPENPTVLERVALVLYRLGKLRDAKAYFERLWELTRNPQFLLKLAVITDREGNTQEAYNLLKVWEKELRDVKDLYFYLAYFAEKLGKDVETEKYLRELLKKSPDADAYNYLAYFLAQRGKKLDEAEKLIEKALKEDPHNPAFLDTKGWVLFKEGNYQEACKYLKEALKLKPDDTVINEHYGECLFNLGKYNEAKKHLLKAFVGVMKNPSIQEEERGILQRIGELLKKISHMEDKK